MEAELRSVKGTGALCPAIEAVDERRVGVRAPVGPRARGRAQGRIGTLAAPAWGARGGYRQWGRDEMMPGATHSLETSHGLFPKIFLLLSVHIICPKTPHKWGTFLN